MRNAIAHLDLKVELRDIHSRPAHLRELLSATGHRTVPVLRIEDSLGNVRWLPESADIVRWLRWWAASPHGNGVAPAP